MMTGKAQIGCQYGFSLLEILVAFSIMAIALGVLLNIFSSGLRTVAVSQDYTAAVQIADAVMAGVGTETPLQQGQKAGIEDDKYHWDLSIVPFDLTTETFDTHAIPAQLYMVTVNVDWDDSGRERNFELATLKLEGKSRAKN